MTTPQFLALAHEQGKIKIFLRTLLFSTGKRGKVIDKLFLKVSHAGKIYSFNFWGYGENENLVVGSGLHVGPDGHVDYHHFIQNDHDIICNFKRGNYMLEVYASLLKKKQPRLLKRIEFS